MGHSSTSRTDGLLFYCPVLEQRHKCGSMDHDILALHHHRQCLRHSWLRRGRVLGLFVQAVSDSHLHGCRHHPHLWWRPFGRYLQRVLGSSTMVQPRCFPERLSWLLLRLRHGCFCLCWYRACWPRCSGVVEPEQGASQCHQAGILADHLVSFFSLWATSTF